MPMSVNTVASRYPERMPQMKGIILSIFLPYTEQTMVTPSVTSAQMRQSPACRSIT